MKWPLPGSSPGAPLTPRRWGFVISMKETLEEVTLV